MDKFVKYKYILNCFYSHNSLQTYLKYLMQYCMNTNHNSSIEWKRSFVISNSDSVSQMVSDLIKCEMCTTELRKHDN